MQGMHDVVEESWGKVQPALKACQKAYNMPGITKEDWKWAFSMVLSRALAVPASAKDSSKTFTCIVPGKSTLCKLASLGLQLLQGRCNGGHRVPVQIVVLLSTVL